MKRVAIIGDYCVDKYWIGRVSGTSAEAPVPVVKINGTLDLHGMAGNVRNLLGDMGGDVSINNLYSGDPCPIKNRLIDESGTQLARWDEQDSCRPYPQHIWSLFEGDASPDAIIVSDYGKGSIDTLAVGRLRNCAERGIPLFIDSKMDPFVWLGVPCTLFPNELEYAAYAAHYNWMPSVVHKMGSEGMRYLQYGQIAWRQPALATQVTNVCGAGDAVIAAFTWAAVQGFSIGDALCIANAAAAQLVSQRFDDRHLRVPEGLYTYAPNTREVEFGSESINFSGGPRLGIQPPDTSRYAGDADVQNNAVPFSVSSIGW